MKDYPDKKIYPLETWPMKIDPTVYWYCKDCLERFCYNERYDAYYCKTCNTWESSQCSDKECSYCVNRPKLPTEKNFCDIQDRPKK